MPTYCRAGPLGKIISYITKMPRLPRQTKLLGLDKEVTLAKKRLLISSISCSLSYTAAQIQKFDFNGFSKGQVKFA